MCKFVKYWIVFLIVVVVCFYLGILFLFEIFFDIIFFFESIWVNI